MKQITTNFLLPCQRSRTLSKVCTGEKKNPPRLKHPSHLCCKRGTVSWINELHGFLCEIRVIMLSLGTKKKDNLSRMDRAITALPQVRFQFTYLDSIEEEVVLTTRVKMQLTMVVKV